MSNHEENAAGYQHITHESIVLATRETLARLELEDHTLRMQAVIANDPDPELSNGEKLSSALERIAAAKARVEKAYAHLLTEPTHEEGTDET